MKVLRVCASALEIVSLCALFVTPRLTWLIPRGIQDNILGQRLTSANAFEIHAPGLIRADALICTWVAVAGIIAMILSLVWPPTAPWILGALLGVSCLVGALTFWAIFAVHLQSTFLDPQYREGVGGSLCEVACVMGAAACTALLVEWYRRTTPHPH